jgi:S-adenosylmethionine/arginine decarboxylase-like enzyme
MSGRHLIIDGVGDPVKLRSRSFVGAFLLRVAELASMQVVDVRVYELPAGPPRPDGGFVDPGGVTGYALLTTSHVSIHTFPETGEFKFDLYSCRDFDPEAVRGSVYGQLGVSSAESEDWDR